MLEQSREGIEGNWQAYLLGRLKEVIASYGIKSPDAQTALLSQLHPKVKEAAEQQITLEAALFAMREQKISPSSKNLSEQQGQIVANYKTSLETLTKDIQTIVEAIAPQ